LVVSKTTHYLLVNQLCFVGVTIILILATWSLDITIQQAFGIVACIVLLVILAVLQGMLLAILAEEKRP